MTFWMNQRSLVYLWWLNFRPLLWWNRGRLEEMHSQNAQRLSCSVHSPAAFSAFLASWSKNKFCQDKTFWLELGQVGIRGGLQTNLQTHQTHTTSTIWRRVATHLRCFQPQLLRASLHVLVHIHNASSAALFFITHVAILWLPIRFVLQSCLKTTAAEHKRTAWCQGTIVVVNRLSLCRLTADAGNPHDKWQSTWAKSCALNAYSPRKRLAFPRAR